MNKERYSRLLEYSSFNEQKLDILLSKKVLLIGEGGVGEYVATTLVTNGVTNLTIVDFDKVEISNLNRQILLTEKDLGLLKVDVVKKALESRNSDAFITAKNMKVTSKNIDELLLEEKYDAVIDAVDNFETKLVIARACKKHHILSLHIGVDGDSGQFALFKEKSLCDIVSEDAKKTPKDGVIGSMVGIVSNLASLHLINYLVGNTTEIDTLFSFNLKTNNIAKIKL